MRSEDMNRLGKLLTPVVLVLAFTGAGPPAALAAPATALLRVAYLPPDGGPADVYLDQDKVLSSVAYKSVSTYLQAAPGAHTVAVRSAGASPSATPQAQVAQDFASGTYSTVAVGGRFGSLQMTVFADQFGQPAPGQTEARFVHMAPDVPAVDVVVPGGPMLFQAIAFLHASPYATLPNGTYTLQLRATGTSNVLFTASDVVATAGTIHSLTGIGGVGQPVELLPIVDAAAAGVSPAGGASTGGGGGGTAAAPRSTQAVPLLAGVALALIAGAGGVAFDRGRRRRRPG
jgi:hypothetical protein